MKNSSTALTLFILQGILAVPLTIFLIIALFLGGFDHFLMGGSIKENYGYWLVVLPCTIMFISTVVSWTFYHLRKYKLAILSGALGFTMFIPFIWPFFSVLFSLLQAFF